uniref:NAC family transcription factor n=1 Tax=Melilotus albus TaxID=47082 RepID=A0A896WDX7_MELAB|nr:NAC family transcription factor [Melilotus albus]
MSLYQAPGFRFHPTDEEIVCFYLKRKLNGKLPPCFDHLAVIDIYKFEPWDLPNMSKLKTKDLEWYFFSGLDKKYGTGCRTNRATDRGYWKTTGKDRAIKNGEETVGMKKTLVYHLGRAPHGNRSNWVMHEYRMIDEELAKAGVQDAYVLCRIFEKSGSGPKNGEKYGAPFVEAEWQNVDEPVDPLPPVDNQLLEQRVAAPAPDYAEWLQSLVAIDNDLLKESLPAPTDDNYLEILDLDQELDTSVTVGNADLPSNFYYGECSSHPQHSQLEAAFGTYDHQVDLYGADSVQDGYNGETNHNENPLNFNFASEDPDLYFDMDEYLMGSNEEYVETNDLKNLDVVNSTVIDPSFAAMLDDEYLDCPDEDITKCICFDCDSPIANHGQSIIEQNAEGKTNGRSLANKHVFEAQFSNEVLPKGDQGAASNWVSGGENAYVKQANKLLANIPAPPAFASEFPTKEFAIGIHPAAESSNSAHITTGMISITDISYRGNAIDWMAGKNGGINTIISTGFTQTAATGLVCKKTAFMLSHGWVYLMGFSVMILSLSLKIGSFMYMGK